jgi:type 1 fimbriae regulatory protein FimB/type 1 fimbriae regulatory protein FimE
MYLWRAVDHEGEVLDMLVQRRRDGWAALRLMRKLLKKQGFVPKLLVTDKLRSYACAFQRPATGTVAKMPEDESGEASKPAAVLRLAEPPPTAINDSVARRRPRKRNIEVRPREYLTEAEVERLITAARRHGRHGHRDATMLLIGFRHGLRVAELIGLRWAQVNLDEAQLHVNRVKRGRAAVHPLGGNEVRALRRLKREQPIGTAFVFVTEGRGPFTSNGFHKLIARVGKLAGLTAVHPHQLRHACGFKLASDKRSPIDIQAYLGHREIKSTMVYIDLSAARFDGFWQD